MAYIDRHTHSTVSDGSCPSWELVRRSQERGLKAIALTYHVTPDGLLEAVAAGQEFDLEVIPGLEVSTQ